MRYRPLARFDSALTLTAEAGLTIGQPLVFDTGTRTTARMDHIVGDGWVLFGVDIDPEHWREAESLTEGLGATRWHVTFDDDQPRGVDIDGLLIDLDGSLYREFEPYRGRFVLMRPDRFTSAVFAPADLPAVLDKASAMFVAQPAQVAFAS